MTLTTFFATKTKELLPQTLPKKLAVAVSGGSDSLALTLLLKDFCTENKIELSAITINHKMREICDQEVIQLGEVLKNQKIPHHILSINQDKIPQSNIEAKFFNK